MFKEVLQEVIDRTEGCLGSLIVGTDGIVVEKVWNPIVKGSNLDIAVAEYTSLLKNAQRANDNMGLGKLQEFTLVGEMGIFILRLVNDDYSIALILSPKGNFGRGRFELSRAKLLLEKELIV